MSVLRSLARSGQLTPTSIAEQTGIRQPHVSRAISELQEHDLVSLAVSENQRKGRLYELTHLGEDVWAKVRSVKWRDDIDAVPDTHRKLVAFLRDELGDQLIAAGYYDGSEINNYYMRRWEQHEFSAEEFADTIETLVEEHGRNDMDASGTAGELRYEVQSFTNFYRLLIYTDGGFVGAALEPNGQYEFPTLMDVCVDILE
jgi:DNA-binding MarR family transcriptional regulator